MILIIKGFIGGIIGSAVRSGSQLVKDVANETSRELDRYATSPLLVSRVFLKQKRTVGPP